MSGAKSIVWFRQDLRIKDNPALLAATEVGEIIPVYIWMKRILKNTPWVVLQSGGYMNL